MQQNFLKSRGEPAGGAALACLSSGYMVNLALVYQDVLTQQWAGQVRELVTGLVGKDAIRCTEWRIGALKEARAFSEGVTALAHADVIVVSLYEAQRLPAAFYLWVNVWLQERSARSGALVALIGPPNGLDQEANPAAANETRRYLHAAANQGRLELLVKECDQPSGPIPVFREDILQLNKAA